MLQIVIEERELYDESRGKFITVRPQVIQLEHSLVSLSEWESKWKVPFLNKNDITEEQFVDYVKCMTITQNVKPEVYRCLGNDQVTKISEYINDSMTATWFRNTGSGRRNRDIITSEIIYYWMISLEIPFEPCQKWHLNRLLTLIRVCDEKNRPGKKMSKSQAAKQYSQLNAARRMRSGSRG